MAPCSDESLYSDIYYDNLSPDDFEERPRINRKEKQMAIPKRPSAATFPSAPKIEAPASKTEQTVDSWDDLKPRGHFIGLYGVGGAGKTTLAATLPGRTLFIDLEGSLKIIKGSLDELGVTKNITPKFIRFDPKAPAAAWNDLIAFLDSDAVHGFDNVVIDSFTRAQEYAANNCMASIPGDSATIKQSLEQWTYGKGTQVVYDKFAPIYPIIDDILDTGTNVCAICHDNVMRMSNPDGGDFIQHQPHLVQGEKGKAPGRDKYQQTVDHLLFLGADITVEKGKAKGGMSRTLYTGGIASMMAKSRTAQGMAFEVPVGGIFDWTQIIK